MSHRRRLLLAIALGDRRSVEGLALVAETLLLGVVARLLDLVLELEVLRKRTNGA
jgi:hypothetical protein